MPSVDWSSVLTNAVWTIGSGVVVWIFAKLTPWGRRFWGSLKAHGGTAMQAVSIVAVVGLCLSIGTLVTVLLLPRRTELSIVAHVMAPTDKTSGEQKILIAEPAVPGQNIHFAGNQRLYSLKGGYAYCGITGFESLSGVQAREQSAAYRKVTISRGCSKLGIVLVVT